MKLLVSTKETQGHRKNDFCFVPEDELVTYPVIECTGEKIDAKCGCKRSMCGLNCHKSSTTFRVVEQPFTSEQLAGICFETMREVGWVPKMGENNARDFARASTDDLVKGIEKFPVGTILERRGDKFKPRT